MEDYLLDRETLEKFIDELMKKHPLPVDNAEEINNFKEEQIRALDNHITKALFDALDESQSAELNTLLDTEQENPEVFQDFFHTHGIDVEKIIAEAAESFSQAYLEGGQNV